MEIKVVEVALMREARGLSDELRVFAHLRRRAMAIAQPEDDVVGTQKVSQRLVKVEATGTPTLAPETIGGRVVVAEHDIVSELQRALGTAAFIAGHVQRRGRVADDRVVVEEHRRSLFHIEGHGVSGAAEIAQMHVEAIGHASHRLR